jgi:hypothetical protein
LLFKHAFLRAALAIFAVLAGMARVGTCVGCGKHVERNLIDEKDHHNNLTKDDKEP